MKMKMYLKDQMLKIICLLVYILIVWLFLSAFRCEAALIIMLELIVVILFTIVFMLEFFKKKAYYDELISNTERLDKKYLVLETLKRPDFYEGSINYDMLSDINKTMIEHVKLYEQKEKNFKVFIEMWVHEIKLPIASLTLMCHNDRENIDKKFYSQIKRLDDYAEQILYYVRAENAKEDYLFGEVSLKTIINKSAMKNKDILLENNIEFSVENTDIKVNTDAKWLEFILNQIVSNSIKYKKASPVIKICAKSIGDKTILSIWDNGIGIPQKDLSRVFNKSFTGSNGRNSSKSTGMGLYIAKVLCEKLGHEIEINSVEGEYTEVSISFRKDSYYETVRN